VVVKVRQERENGMLLAEPRFYALKLANTDKPANYIKTLADPDELAKRERNVYQKVWSTVNPATGQIGHPFILRLECSCDWPDGVELFVEGTREPVESVDGRNRNRTFHRALMLEYCPLGDLGGELSAHMRRGVDDATPSKSLEWFKLAQRYSAEVLLALEYLHRQDIVYRDLKPENVLVVADKHEQKHAKLGDFGFAKVVGPTEGSKSLAGSPYFSPPEMMTILKQGRQRELDGPAVDVFSFGAMLFCIFYGCEVLKKSRTGS
jgi:serine/threonine protein kinase